MSYASFNSSSKEGYTSNPVNAGYASFNSASKEGYINPSKQGNSVNIDQYSSFSSRQGDQGGYMNRKQLQQQKQGRGQGGRGQGGRGQGGYGQPKSRVPPVMQVQDAKHRLNLIKTNGIVCIKVYSDHCLPCKQIAPKFAEMAAEYGRQGCMLATENIELGLTKNVNGVPTFCFYKNARPITTVVGADLKKVQWALDKMLSED